MYVELLEENLRVSIKSLFSFSVYTTSDSLEHGLSHLDHLKQGNH